MLSIPTSTDESKGTDATWRCSLTSIWTFIIKIIASYDCLTFMTGCLIAEKPRVHNGIVEFSSTLISKKSGKWWWHVLSNQHKHACLCIEIHNSRLAYWRHIYKIFDRIWLIENTCVVINLITNFVHKNASICAFYFWFAFCLIKRRWNFAHCAT